MRPEAVVFLVTVGIVVPIAMLKRVTTVQPVDERRDHPFPYATPGQYLYGAVLAALVLAAAGIGHAAILGARVVVRARHAGQDKPA